MHEYLISFLGGTLLGISAVGYLYVHGCIAGVSGLLAQSLNIKNFINSPAFWFLTGLIVVPFIYALFTQPEINIQASPFSMIIAGLLVGFGTRLGSGCTSRTWHLRYQSLITTFITCHC